MLDSINDPAGKPPVERAPDAPARASSMSERRYDVDWLRALAVMLLIVFHSTLWFLSTDSLIVSATPGGMRNETSLDFFVPLDSFLTVWRIPILFLISGISMRFSLQRRDWKHVLADRTLRIALPLVFGTLVINALSAVIVMRYVHLPVRYYPNLGHLWFLAYIAAYDILLLPLLVWLRQHPANALTGWLSRSLRHAWLLPLVALPLVLEAVLIRPPYFVVYIGSAHGFLLGIVCFLMGFQLAMVGRDFWLAACQMRWVSLALALACFIIRFQTANMFLDTPLPWLAALESINWILALLGFAGAHFNHPSPILSYATRAVPPVYIMHYPVQLILCYLLLPAAIPAILKWILVLVGSFSISLGSYEFVVRRVKWLRPLFGMKLNETQRP